MKKITTMLILTLFLLSFIVYAQDEDVDLTPPSFFGFTKFMNNIPIINLIPTFNDESVVVDGLKLELAQQEQLVSTEEQFDNNQITEEQFDIQAIDVENNIQEIESTIVENTNDIIQSDSNIDISDIQDSINEVASVEPTIEQEDIQGAVAESSTEDISTSEQNTEQSSTESSQENGDVNNGGESNE